MSNIVKALPIDISEVNIAWMVNSTLASVTFHEPTLWIFTFAEGGFISAESAWRVLASDKFVVSGEDHGYRFGLPGPVDSADKARSVLIGAIVTSAAIHKPTTDLIITFDQNRQLEILCTSIGYESWQVRDPFGTCFVAKGSGRMSTWKE